jgi:hypothetical protein
MLCGAATHRSMKQMRNFLWIQRRFMWERRTSRQRSWPSHPPRTERQLHLPGVGLQCVNMWSGLHQDINVSCKGIKAPVRSAHRAGMP